MAGLLSTTLAEGVDVGVLEVVLVLLGLLVVGLWAAKRRVVPSMPTWRRPSVADRRGVHFVARFAGCLAHCNWGGGWQVSPFVGLERGVVTHPTRRAPTGGGGPLIVR